MKTTVCLPFLYVAGCAWAHGSHEASGPSSGESMKQYAQRHMSSEHHIDTFDVQSFFQLHDLNRDGYWDREEIEAVYGVHHVYSQKKSKDDEEHQKKADYIVDTILNTLDTNKDGRVSVSELEKVGLDGLPNFDHMGAEGHHYDVESEFFLHHEEQFHSTPETQTDESYNHAEDLEHFAHHEDIERKEAIKEAKYQGLSVEEVLKQHEEAERRVVELEKQLRLDIQRLKEGGHREEPAPAVSDQDQDQVGKQPIAPHPHDEQVIPVDPVQEPPKPKVTRITPPEKQDPKVRYKSAKSEGDRKGEWGTGDDGYKPPSNPGDKMRKNLPYKYKFRRNWGDF